MRERLLDALVRGPKTARQLAAIVYADFADGGPERDVDAIRELIYYARKYTLTDARIVSRSGHYVLEAYPCGVGAGGVTGGKPWSGAGGAPSVGGTIGCDGAGGVGPAIGCDGLASAGE